MEQVKHDTVDGVSEKRYTRPRAKVVFVKTQGMLCVSNPDKYTTEMEAGNDNW